MLILPPAPAPDTDHEPISSVRPSLPSASLLADWAEVEAEYPTEPAPAPEVAS